MTTDNQDKPKMWYSIQEATAALGIDENTLSRKMIFYHIESRHLPGMKGQYISKGDYETIKAGLPTKMTSHPLKMRNTDVPVKS